MCSAAAGRVRCPASAIRYPVSDDSPSVAGANIRGSAVRDFADLRFSDLADAASVRSCGTCSVAMQRMSRIQSFTCVDLKETETILSPQLGQMGKERETVAVDCLVWNVCFRAKLSVDPALSGL